MLRFGAHESVSGGLYRAIERGVLAGCASLQVWTANPRQWHTAPLDPEVIAQFKEARAAVDIHPIVAHAAYLINIASPNDVLFRRSVDSLIQEVERCEQLEIPYLVLHPGAHTGSGMDAGLRRATRGLRMVMDALPGYRTAILLETTSGQGTALGRDFESLATLLDRVAAGPRLGVCLDTCHVFAAGYELRTAAGYAATMEAFDRVVGLVHLRALHLNDSRHPKGSGRDRHAHIGEGELGLEGFVHLVSDPRLAGLPGILETPKGDDLHEDRENLARLRALAAGEPVEIRPLDPPTAQGGLSDRDEANSSTTP